jgi:hypothetical protein
MPKSSTFTSASPSPLPAAWSKIASTGATSTRKSRALEHFSRTMRFKQWKAAMCTCSSTAPPLTHGRPVNVNVNVKLDPLGHRYTTSHK